MGHLRSVVVATMIGAVVWSFPRCKPGDLGIMIGNVLVAGFEAR
jgi:hypothetical protein